MAWASVSWASFDSAPCDIAPVEKRLTMARGRLHLVDRHRFRRRDQLEQVVELDHRPVVGQLGEGVVALGRLGADGRLQQVGGQHLPSAHRPEAPAPAPGR